MQHMIEAKSGRIVNLASGQWFRPVTGLSIYAASKGGIAAFSKSAALELAPYNVNVNTVAPGFTDTPLCHSTLPGEAFEQASTQTALKPPLGRINHSRMTSSWRALEIDREAKESRSTAIYLTFSPASYGGCIARAMRCRGRTGRRDGCDALQLGKALLYLHLSRVLEVAASAGMRKTCVSSPLVRYNCISMFWSSYGGSATSGGSMTTFNKVLRLAQRLPPTDQARLRDALAKAEEAARAEQIARNQAAIAMLDAWAAADEADDGDVSWEEMLQALDQDRESTRRLYPHPRPGSGERLS